MGQTFRRRVDQLSPGFVLAPERYDPRRLVAQNGSTRIGDLLGVAREAWRPSTDGRPVLVLDTSHAFEGAVRLRHPPIDPGEVGSAKRSLEPGDVIVSRLRPYLRQVALVDAALFSRAPGGNDVACSTEFYVLRGAGAAAVVPWLLGSTVQAALAASQEGGHHPRVSLEAVLDLPVPAGLLERWTEAAQAVQERIDALREAGDGVEALVREDW